MKTASIAAALAVLSEPCLAFPNMPLPAGSKTLKARASAASSSATYTPTFNPEKQFVDLSGLHAWQAPGPLDTRGPCPGLNAMANHAYLPRSGLALVSDLTIACNTVFSMGLDLSAILSAYGGVFDGLGVAWSIGGPFHVGIGGSHNNYESDSSPCRGDLHQYGSNTDLVMSQFMALYNLQPDAATANYDIAVLKTHRRNRFYESIAKNPWFFYGPFAGPGVTQAAHSFIPRFMSNHSYEYPDGILNKEVLKSFFSITGPENNLTWVPGHERIPDNWYKRDPADAYGLGIFERLPIFKSASGRSLSTDINYICEGQEEICKPGCNMGKVNSFVNINTTDTSKGVYQDQDQLKNVLCFGIAYANAALNFIPIVSTVNQELILPIQNLVGCPTIEGLDESALQACPGYSFYQGPTGSVVPGAIQD